MADTTPGMVCAHHHLYSALARGMPAPPKQPTRFGEILEQVWWRLDTALDLDMIRASALLGATEALMSGTTAIVDHHESPNAIEGSLDVIAEACAEVGVRVGCAAPARRPNPVVLGTDGIGADMLEEMRLAYVAHRADDLGASPDDATSWLAQGYSLVPEARDDRVTWSYDHVDSPWHVAFTPGIRALRVVDADGRVLLDHGRPTLVDLDEVRA